MKAGLVTVLLAAAAGCGASALTPAARAADTDTTPCQMTLPNGRVPTVYGRPARDAGVNHGNGKLYVGLWQDGQVVVPSTEVRPDGSIDAKFGWWRAVSGKLRIAASRLDAQAPPARVHIPSGYGSKWFQSTIVTFPSSGCWRVTGTLSGGVRLTFVTLVLSRT